MIKLTRKEDKVLSGLNGIEDASIKTDLINWLFTGDGLLSETFNTDESKLKATQAILDGKWEVEEPLYYVHLLEGEGGYLNIGKHSGVKGLSTKHGSITYKTQFTRAEVKAIDQRYLEFLEEVE